MRRARETPQVNYVETSCHICKMGIQNVLRLLRDQRIKCIARCLEESALRTSSLPLPQIQGFPTTLPGSGNSEKPVIPRNRMVFCFSAQGTAT